MRAKLTSEANDELNDAARWYQRQARLGHAFLSEALDAIFAIERNPERYPLAEIYEGPREIRRIQLDKFPYVLIYEVLPNRLRVIAIAHGARDQSYWVSRVDS